MATIGVGPPVAGLSEPWSRLVLGTAFYTVSEQAQWCALLDRFLELGGTTVDSAHSYGDSERVLGAWRASRRPASLRVITKGAHGQALLPAGNFGAVIEAELAQSLADLGVEVVDLYCLHRDNPAVPVARIMAKLAELVGSGRVRAVGASNWTYERIAAAQAWAAEHGSLALAAVSNNLSLAVPTEPFYPNLVTTDAAGEAWHRAQGLPLIAWSSQARGFFAGRWNAALRDDPIALGDPYTKRMLTVYGTDDNFLRRRRAQSLGATKGGYSATQIASAWLLAKPFAVAPVIGPRTIDELDACVAAQSIDLTHDECRWLNLEEPTD